MAVSPLAGASLAIPSVDDSGEAGPTTRAAAAPDFAALYDAHAKLVWRAVVRLGVEPMAVEDVVQEIFLVVHRGLDDFQWRSSVATWIYGIAINVVRHHRRSRSRKEPALDGGELVEPQTLPANPAHAPDAVFEKNEALRLVLRLLGELPDDLREVFVLAELEEMTLAEIAEVLGANPNTISSRLRAARKHFEKALTREHARETWRVR